MRIIRNQKVNDGIIHYWNHIDNVSQAVNMHTAYRAKGRDMETRIFNVADMYLKNSGDVTLGSIELSSHSPELIKEYANVVAYSGVMPGSLQNFIIDQGKLANELIELIKKEYHLK